MCNLLALPTQETDSVAARHNSHTPCSEKQVIAVYRILQAGTHLHIINCYLHLLTISASEEEKSVEEKSVKEKIWIAARLTFITGLGESFPMSLEELLQAPNLQRQREGKIAVNLIGSYHWLTYLGVLLFLLSSATEICRTEIFKHLYT